MCAKKKRGERYREIRNAKAYRDYFVEEKLEAGIVLTGTEVKAIRMGKAQISDSFARIERGEVILYHAHIEEYAFGSLDNHNPTRPRKLLLKRKQIDRLESDVRQGGKSLIPLRVYFKEGLIKVEIGLGIGKKKYDKRQALKEKEDKREVDRAMKHRR